MKFKVIWKFKNKDDLHVDIICAKDLDEAGKIADKKYHSVKRDWIDIRYAYGVSQHRVVTKVQ